MTERTYYLHLVPRETWERHSDDAEYTPEAFAADGFIHLTIGAENLIAVGNRYYRTDPRDYVALVLDPENIASPVRFDDESGTFPHIYGPLNTSAVCAAHVVLRQPDGTFIGISEVAG